MMEESDGKSMAREETMSTVFGVPHETVTLGGEDGEPIIDLEYLCNSLGSVIERLRINSCNVTPDILDVVGNCSMKLSDLVSSIAKGYVSDNDDNNVLKLQITNPLVHVEDYDGPLCHLKSMWSDDKRFSINLRFDLNSFSDLEKFIDYFMNLTEKVDTMNMPFVRYKYRINSWVEFSNPAIVEEG
jgi:hypothetical protein